MTVVMFLTRDAGLSRVASKRSRMLGALAVILALTATACGDDPPADTSGGRTRGMGGASQAAAPAAPAATAGPAAEGAPVVAHEALVFKDEDFAESVSNRDPFRSYTTLFKAELPDGVQRRVYMPTTSVEEMRLIAIVTGVPKPKAMLVDPGGVGHVVERGDYVGRPKVIQASGNVAMTLNWRVDRIRDNEVVLSQEDATDPTRIAMTKIIPLREGPTE